MLNYWWVTRPKRRLTSIPEVLAAFSSVALNASWEGARDLHLLFEEELENSGLKKVGDRRDRRGSGGRTYQAWLFSLGLVFTHEASGRVHLTLAGEAIMEGKSPVEVLKHQVLRYQFPSPFSIATNKKNRLHERFKIRPFVFLLRLLCDERVEWLTQEEIAKVVMVEADSESEECYNRVTTRLWDFRERKDLALPSDFFERYAPSSGKVNENAPYAHLLDVANTIVNWLEYTQLVYRDEGTIKLLPEKIEEARLIVATCPSFIERPEEREFFQRKYGLDPWRRKDTRNLSATPTVTAKNIEKQKVKQAFISLSIKRPIGKITVDLVEQIAEQTGVNKKRVEDVLNSLYPKGAIGGFMTEYFEMAFKGQDEAIHFEEATTAIFRDIFGFQAQHIGQVGGRPTPDILLLSDEDNYQAIIDNKAYGRYSLNNDHYNRMAYNYIGNLTSYSLDARKLAFFSYIAGGFAPQFNAQVKRLAEQTGVHGSGMTVSNMIRLIEKQQTTSYTHRRLREIFSLDRQIALTDI